MPEDRSKLGSFLVGLAGGRGRDVSLLGWKGRMGFWFWFSRCPHFFPPTSLSFIMWNLWSRVLFHFFLLYILRVMIHTYICAVTRFIIIIYTFLKLISRSALIFFFFFLPWLLHSSPLIVFTFQAFGIYLLSTFSKEDTRVNLYL